MDKVETVALMAATILAARAAGPLDEVGYERIAAEAWALHDAVEKEGAGRHSRR
jgi:hypothetical protein